MIRRPVIRREDRREHADAEPARGRGAVGAVDALEEARAGDHVQLRRRAQVGEQLGDVARVVLAVAVDLDRDVVAVLERVQVARLDRAADAEVERMA